jgi:transposase
LILAKKIGKNKKVIKNWMYANSIHLIDLINFFSSNSNYKVIKKKITKKLNKKIIQCVIKTKNITFNYKGYWNIDKRW